MSKFNKQYDVIMGQGPDLIAFYRANPCIAAYDLLGADLAPIQRIVFEDMWFKGYVIGVASRGFGKTYLLGLLAALSSLLYPGYRTGLVSASFRQSKLIFAEVEKLYDQSSIFREACLKRPIRGSDSCYIKLKSIAGHNGSFIEALPLGNDGAKIRGSRFYLLCADEFAQIPDQIINMVLKPMSITKLDPMKKVRELERRNRLIAAGLATDEDFEDDSINKFIATSSGFYKFNHMYRRMREYWNRMEQGGKNASEYIVHQVPYMLLPPGFLDENNVKDAEASMSDHEFRMEYMADMVSDSEGFFKASLFEACTLDSKFFVEYRGVPASKYIIGVDPNQGGKAECGLVIVKLGSDYNRVVRVMAIAGNTTQEITSTIQQLCEDFNIIRIFMDRGGGGKAVCDLLEEGYNGKTPILNRAEADNLKKDGKHILELISFNSAWISDANFATLALIEDKKLRFPERALSTGSEADDFECDKVDDLKKQCLSIIVTSTSTGALHFDTPKKSQNKDLYSAFILAGYGAKLLELEADGEQVSNIYSVGGLVRQHNTQQQFRLTSGAQQTIKQEALAAAVLKRRK